MSQKCSVCSQNWADCIHMTYDDVYGATRRKWITWIMASVAVALIVSGIVAGVTA